MVPLVIILFSLRWLSCTLMMSNNVRSFCFDCFRSRWLSIQNGAVLLEEVHTRYWIEVDSDNRFCAFDLVLCDVLVGLLLVTFASWALAGLGLMCFVCKAVT